MSKKRDEELSEQRRPVSPWVPVALLSLTTAALVVPYMVLRRQRAAALGLGKPATASTTSAMAPPPRRPRRPIPMPIRTPSSSSTLHATKSTPGAPPPRIRPRISSGAQDTLSAASTSSASPAGPLLSSASASGQTYQEPEIVDDGFNATLYGFKAFGTATAAVLIMAAGGILGVKSYMGVQDMRDFATRMRTVLDETLPGLAARINRALDSAPMPPVFSLPISLPPPSDEDRASDAALAISEEESHTWTWAEAKERLGNAYTEGGVAGWAEVALREMELEATQLRGRSGLSPKTDRRS